MEPAQILFSIHPNYSLIPISAIRGALYAASRLGGLASRWPYCLAREWQVGKLEPSRNRALEGVYRLWASPCLFSHVARMEPWRLQKLYSPGAQSDNLGCG